jgi:hypothetical protein
MVTDDDLVMTVAERRNGARRLVLLPAVPASRVWYRSRPVVALLLASGGLVGWIIALAARLPARYVVGHWDLAWVGFDTMLLISLVAAAWLFARRSYLAPTAFLITAAQLVCDAWFDVTMASPADTVLSVVSAVAIELPLAAVMAWVGGRQLRRDAARAAAARAGVPGRSGMAGGRPYEQPQAGRYGDVPGTRVGADTNSFPRGLKLVGYSRSMLAGGGLSGTPPRGCATRASRAGVDLPPPSPIRRRSRVRTTFAPAGSSGSPGPFDSPGLSPRP